jgi:hypothetical protein
MRIKLTKWRDYESIVSFPVFAGYRIHLVFTDSISKSRAGRYGSDGGSTDVNGLYLPTTGADGFVFLCDWKPHVIAHEGFHAVRHMLMDWAGCEMDNENIAYHLSFLVEQIYNFKSKVEALNEAKRTIVEGRITATRRNAHPPRKAKARPKNASRPLARRNSAPKRRTRNRG